MARNEPRDLGVQRARRAAAVEAAGVEDEDPQRQDEGEERQVAAERIDVAEQLVDAPSAWRKPCAATKASAVAPRSETT